MTRLLTSTALAGLLMTLTTSAVHAQEPVDVSRLPIDLQKIHRELRDSAVREEREGLNLRYTVDVYGQAPPIVIVDPDFDLRHGPVPHSAPTHRDMIEHVTPPEFRSPPADLSALFRWLAERAKK